MRTPLLALAALVLAAPLPAADQRPRNLLLLVGDDLGHDLSCYGGKIPTPNLEALARDGTIFPHAFATVASCSPSRAVLLTGLHTHTSGQYGLAHAVHNAHTRAPVQSLPRLLKAAGYRTGVIAKLHVLPASVYPFDAEVNQGTAGGRDVAGIAEQARRFIAESGDKPFFLLVGYTDPHRAVKGFANEKPFPNVPRRRFDPNAVAVPYHLPDRPEVRAELAEYYQSVSRLDHGVGLMMKLLRETGRDKDTLVVFLSDNGIPFPGAKTTLYDAGVHLPLIVRSPAQTKRGVVNRAMASWVDVTPTFLDWAGVKPPANLTGRSLLPILDAENPPGWDEVYGSHQFHEITMYYPMRMVRTRQFKYLLNLAHALDFPFASDLHGSATWQGVLKRGDGKLGQRSVESFLHRPKEELYDIENDPNELKNLASDPKYADTLAELRKKMRAWQERTQDPWLVKYRYE